MPEGPEIWILSQAINVYFENDNTYSIGKHLFLKEENEDWSFGLNGKVSISPLNDLLVKIDGGWLNGEKKQIETNNKLGVDWIQGDAKMIENEIKKWMKSKKKLGVIMLEQDKISGIGVAWGSELLFASDLRPDMRCCDQKLDKLIDVILTTRDKIKNTYMEHLNMIKYSRQILKLFIDEWFLNLYDIRDMNIYKKGSKVMVNGRNWWV